MNPILRLRDIQGLDAISFWPLALGWWLLLGCLIFAGAAVWFLRRRRNIRQQGWRYKTCARLTSLERQITPENCQEIAVELSSLMRRLALKRHPRQECASLTGESWLNWLTKKDLLHFDWLRSAGSLVDAPYCVPGTLTDANAVKKWIHAAQGWVKSC